MASPIKLLAAAAALLATTAFGGPADLDPQYGQGGIEMVRAGRSSDEIRTIAVLPDGRILAAGHASNESVVVRYLPGGAVDTSFGQGGIARLTNPRVASAWLRSDGKLIVGGPCASTVAHNETCIARLSANGQPDDTFGTSGVARINLTSAVFALRPDDRILVAAAAGGITVRQLTPDGALDVGFGSAGEAVQSLPVTSVAAVAIQTDGKVVVTGHRGTDFYAARFTASGAVDTVFGFAGSGLGAVPIGDSAGAHAGSLQPDGKIVVAGCSIGGYLAPRQMSIARFDIAGQPDASFGVGGASHFPGNNAEYACAGALAPLSDGRLLVAGGSYFIGSSAPGAPAVDTQNKLNVLLLAENGALDPSFGDAGRVRLQLRVTGFGNPTGDAALAIQADGRIIAGGGVLLEDVHGTQVDFGIARLLSGGALDAGFDGDGYVTTELRGLNGGSFMETRLDPSGRLVALTRPRSSGASLLRRLPTGAPDTTFGEQGQVQVLGPVTPINKRPLMETANALAVQPDGKIVVGGRGWEYLADQANDYAGAMVIRHNADGSVDTGFGSGGHVRIAFSNSQFESDTVVHAAEVLSDGRIVVAGLTPNQSAAFVSRLTSTGAGDPGFGTNGTYSFSFNTSGLRNAVSALAVQADGKMLVLGSFEGNPRELAVARLSVSGALDTSFGFGGRFQTQAYKPATINPCFTTPLRALVQPDGRIVVVTAIVEPIDGCSFRYSQRGQLSMIRLTPGGAIDGGFGQSGLAYPDLGPDVSVRSARLAADGYILVTGGRIITQGQQGYTPFVARFTPNGLLDPSFGVGGIKDVTELPGFSVADVAVQADTRIVGAADGPGELETLAVFRLGTSPDVALTVTKNGDGSGAVTSSPAGIDCGSACTGNFPAGTDVVLTATAAGGTVFAGWSGGGCSGTATCAVAVEAATSVNALFMSAAATGMSVTTPGSLEFGGQSMRTSTPTLPVTLTNVGGTTLTVGTIYASNDAFAQANDCGASLAPSASCVIQVRFTPLFEGATTGTLVVPTGSSVIPLPLSGTGERSLVTHYYRAILGRTPDATGKDFWESEAARLTALGVNINETWFVMAGYFFNSAEYLAANKPNEQFVADLYNTFFNRPPDPSGLAYWVGQINSGLPREVALFSFLFSTEFRTFTQTIFGSTAARPEVDMVVDFFRGLLNRLPDTPSFNYWLGRLRQAQCQGAGPVYTMVDEISAAFMFNPEYANRARSNTQFVTDMYYSFLRRGGDVGGVNYWINEINTGARFRNDVRYFGFLNSAEFGARVQAVIAAGCF